MKALAFLILLTVALPMVRPAIAQDPPAKTYQPGFWQPVTRFNAEQPVEVIIQNNTDIQIEYDITELESTNPTSLPAGQTGRLQGFGNSAVIVIYSLVDSSSDFTLRFDVTVDEAKNLVNVSVLKEKPTFFGHRAVNLQKTGAVFVY